MDVDLVGLEALQLLRTQLPERRRGCTSDDCWLFPRGSDRWQSEKKMGLARQGDQLWLVFVQSILAHRLGFELKDTNTNQAILHLQTFVRSTLCPRTSSILVLGGHDGLGVKLD